MNFLGWFWVRVATTGHLSCLVSPIHCKHENKTYAAAPRSFIPNTHSSPSPAIGKPFSDRVRMRKRFLTNLSLWLLFIFWIAIYELPPKQHRNARPPRGVESPRTKHVFLQLCLTTQLYIQPYSKKSFTNREEERVQISGWGVDHHRCHHTSHNCFLVTSVNPNNYIPRSGNTCTLEVCACLEF